MSPNTNLPETHHEDCFQSGKVLRFLLPDFLVRVREDQCSGERTVSEQKVNTASAFAGGTSCRLTCPWAIPPGNYHVCGAQVLAHLPGLSSGCSGCFRMHWLSSFSRPLLQDVPEAGRNSLICPFHEKHFALVGAWL